METREAEHLSLRASDDGTAKIDGRAVPYGQTISVGGMSETFARGAVDPEELVGKTILWQHDRAEVIGHITEARNEDDGAYFTGTLIDTTRGRDAITALRAGAIKGLSIGFQPVEESWDGTHVTRTSVRIGEVSVATIPAYPDAEVLAVRNQEEKEHPVETTTPEVPTVDLDNLATREDLTALESRMSTMLTPPAPVERIHVREQLSELVRAYGNDPTQKSLLERADMVSSGNTGLTSTARTSKELIE